MTNINGFWKRSEAMKRKLNPIGLSICLISLLLFVTPAFAGGWVVITLDSLPGGLRAGEPITLGFMVRQHGVTPRNDVSPVLIVVNQDTGQRLEAEAVQNGQTGHFEASLEFPSAGQWELEITAPPFSMGTTFEPMTVLPAAPLEPAMPQAPWVSDARSAMRWAGASLLGVAALLALLGMRRRGEAARQTMQGGG
jgi:hypothetical protein